MQRIEQAVLADYTTFRLGGPCRELLDCTCEADLREALRHLHDRNASFEFIGGGSNLLVADEGLDECVLRYASEAPQIERDGDALVVGAATKLEDLAAYSVEAGLGGLVSCSGIPGTVGGAVAGNAGAFGEQIGDFVVSARLMDRSGVARDVPAAELGFAYRCSAIQRGTDVIVSVRLGLAPADRAALFDRRSEILALRASKHPDWHVTPTAGSFFKNIEPTSKAERRQAAGWFLEQAGAKDLRVGGARTFERHANILVADPGCRAADVLELSRQMAARVREKFGFDLQREVRLLGRFQ